MPNEYQLVKSSQVKHQTRDEEAFEILPLKKLCTERVLQQNHGAKTVRNSRLIETVSYNELLLF